MGLEEELSAQRGQAREQLWLRAQVTASTGLGCVLQTATAETCSVPTSAQLSGSTFEQRMASMGQATCMWNITYLQLVATQVPE